jgi:hypothetical protein
VSEIYRTLEEGIVRNGMASYNYLTAKDRFALAHLIRSWHPSPAVDAATELANLELVYQLSKGQVRAAQIPVKKATELILKESAPTVAVFSRVVSDPARAIAALTARGYRMGSADELVRVVTADPVKLGFRASVSQLRSEDWTALHLYLGRIDSRR